jgi:putative thiamine transport system permease protein
VPAVRLGLDGGWLALVWSHLLFVLPYVFLALAEPYRSLDPRYGRAARCLGAGPERLFWRVRLPMLLRPLLFAAAVGFAVSVAQYLPTLFAGAGRFATLTTEAVALSAGGDRRVLAVYAFLQALLPLLAFLAAAALPAWLFRQRRGMRPAA